MEIENENYENDYRATNLTEETSGVLVYLLGKSC